MDNKIEVYYPKDTVVNIYPKPARHLNHSYTRLFSEEAVNLAIDKSLSGTDFRVLLYMIGNLQYNNILNVSQEQIHQQSGITQANISRSIKKLIAKGYVQIIDRIGRQNIYMLNPSVAFKAWAYNLKLLKRSWDNACLPEKAPAPVDIDEDLDVGDKLDDKVTELSEQFNVPQSKVRQIILSLVNQTTEDA